MGRVSLLAHRGAVFRPDSPHTEVFLSWFFHHWAPDPHGTSIEDESLHDRSPARVLLDTRAARLDVVLRRYLEACLDEPLSFHEVIRSDPGRALWTRDLFTGVEHEILERSASRTLEKGDTFFGMLVTTDDITLIEACGTHVIAPGKKLELIDFRERIARRGPLSADTLREWDIEMREVYLDLIDRIMNPPPPRFQNTDGEDIVFHHMVFEIDSPREALTALKDLALDETEDDLLEQAEFDPAGELRRVSFAWKAAGSAALESWKITVLGHLEIDGRELRVEVNSSGRAATLRTMLEARMGDAIRHVHKRVESVDEALEEHEAREPRVEDAPAVATSPELLELMREFTAAHYESWLSEPVPALGGLTPTDAVADRVGREKVEALITEMQRTSTTMDPPVDESVFVRMRERLGLLP